MTSRDNKNLNKGNTMITSRKELAIALTEGNVVEVSNVSKRLDRVCKLWASRKEIIIADNKITSN